MDFLVWAGLGLVMLDLVLWVYLRGYLDRGDYCDQELSTAAMPSERSL